MDKKLRTWLWLSVLLTIVGAFLFYPIGAAFLNGLFVLIKIGMAAGLLVLLFRGGRFGFYLWTACCAGAVILTLIKWSMIGGAALLFIAGIAADILAPAVAFALMRKQ